MPREVTLPPIRLSPEGLAKMVFKKSVADSKDMPYESAENPPVLDTGEPSVVPPCGRVERLG